jgi:hypothetical protein
MTLNELQIDDVFEYGSYTLKLKNITLTYYISDIISSNYLVLSKKLYIPRAMYTLDQYQCKLISRNNMQNPIQEIQSLKIELQNIQNRIQKLEEENQLELGGIYEIHYQGNIIKGCLVEESKYNYRFITKTTPVYICEKHLITSFKKLPDESVKQFFKKDSK